MEGELRRQLNEEWRYKDKSKVREPGFKQVPNFSRGVGDGVDSSIIPPIAVTQKALWFSADFGAYSDTAGTLLCNNGDSVKVWVDRSGNGRNTSLLDAFPSYKVSQVAGYPCIRFTSIQSIQTGVYTISGGFTFFIVGRIWNTNQDTNYFMGNRIAGITYGLRYQISTTTWGDSSLVGSSTADITKFYCFNGVNSGPGTNYYLSNTLLVTGTSNSTTWNNPVIGTSDTGGDIGGNVDIAEILVLNNQVNDYTRRGLVAYFQAKYGIP